MQEVIHPDGDIQSRDNGFPGGNALPLTHAEQETGLSTAESKQHLNVDTSEYEGKDQNKKMSVFGKVKEKAKNLKSKVKKGLKIGSSGEKEIPSDEVSSIDSEVDDDESAVVQEQGTKDAGSNLEEKPVQQILEKNPQFKVEATSDEGGPPFVADLVEDGRKPITPIKNDGPVDTLQAVPTQYRDYYHNPTSDSDQMHSGEMKEEKQSHQASAGDKLEKTCNGCDNLLGGLSDAFSESFLGALNGSQHLQGPTSHQKSGSQEEGSRQEIEHDKLSDNKSAELGKTDAASDMDGIHEEGSRQEIESDKLSDSKSAELGKTDAASDMDGIHEEGSRQEIESDKFSDSKSAELGKRDAASDRDGIYEGDNSTEPLSSDWDRQGDKGADLSTRTSQDEKSEESPVSADLDTQVNKRSEPTEDGSKSTGNLEGNILPKFEAAVSREENQKPTLVSEARCEDDKDEERKADTSDAAFLGEENNQSGRKFNGSNSETETSGDNKQLEPPLDKKAREAFGIGQVSQSGYEADADSNPPSEEEGIAVHSLHPTHSQRSQPYDSSSSLEMPDQTFPTPSEADKESSQEAIKLESNKEGSLGEKRENSLQSVQGQDTTISQSADASEGGGVRTWSEWLTQGITPAKEKPSSIPGAGEPDQDGKKDVDTKTKVDTENP